MDEGEIREMWKHMGGGRAKEFDQNVGKVLKNVEKGMMLGFVIGFG